MVERKEGSDVKPVTAQVSFLNFPLFRKANERRCMIQSLQAVGGHVGRWWHLFYSREAREKEGARFRCPNGRNSYG